MSKRVFLLLGRVGRAICTLAAARACAGPHFLLSLRVAAHRHRLAPHTCCDWGTQAMHSHVTYWHNQGVAQQSIVNINTNSDWKYILYKFYLFNDYRCEETMSCLKSNHMALSSRWCFWIKTYDTKRKKKQLQVSPSFKLIHYPLSGEWKTMYWHSWRQTARKRLKLRLN